MLLEKAWAKSKKSYSGIISGNPASTFIDLTGAPAGVIEFDDKEAWSKIMEGLKKKHLMTTGTYPDKPEHKELIK